IEVLDLARRAANGAGNGTALEKAVPDVMAWTGGQPFLVQLLLRRLIDSAAPSVSLVVAALQRDRPPAFHDWRKRLVDAMTADEEVRGIVGSLLHEKEGVPEGRDKEEPTALRELTITGWIRLDEQTHQWRWRSECRAWLAREAAARLPTR